MQLFSLLVMNYLLPRLVGQSDQAAQNAELKKTGGAMLALFLVGGTAFYMLRDIVFRIAFSSEFVDASSLVLPQLFGDFAKVVSWLLVYRLVAQHKHWVQAAAEFTQSVGLIAFYFLLLAPVYAHLLSCIVLLTALVTLNYRIVRQEQGATR
jgi:hypothetical protein